MGKRLCLLCLGSKCLTVVSRITLLLWQQDTNKTLNSFGGADNSLADNVKAVPLAGAEGDAVGAVTSAGANLAFTALGDGTGLVSSVLGDLTGLESSILGEVNSV